MINTLEIERILTVSLFLNWHVTHANAWILWYPNPIVLPLGMENLGSQFICWWVSLHSY